MKFYKAQMSGRLMLSMLSDGVHSDFDQKVTVSEGIPEHVDGALIQVRLNENGIIDLLFVTDEAATEDFEAADVWSIAEHFNPTWNVEQRKVDDPE